MSELVAKEDEASPPVEKVEAEKVEEPVAKKEEPTEPTEAEKPAAEPVVEKESEKVAEKEKEKKEEEEEETVEAVSASLLVVYKQDWTRQLGFSSLHCMVSNLCSHFPCTDVLYSVLDISVIFGSHTDRAL
jgi:hypothetical protein